MSSGLDNVFQRLEQLCRARNLSGNACSRSQPRRRDWGLLSQVGLL